MVNTPRRLCTPASALSMLILTGSAFAGFVLPDNGSGSANLPPVGCVYTTPLGDMHIVDGLPVGSTIEIDSTLGTFSYSMATPPAVMSFPANATGRMAGGSLGGEMSAANAVLQMPMIGNNALLGFNRNIPMPVSLEIHAAPKINFAPIQSFDTDMFRFFGQVIGDPDFDLLRIVAGTDFGLPSPGHTTFTQAGPGWAIDSFFDITYRIDFVGSNTGQLAGRSGSTTGTVRISIVPAPGAGMSALVAAGMLAARRRRR